MNTDALPVPAETLGATTRPSYSYSAIVSHMERLALGLGVALSPRDRIIIEDEVRAVLKKDPSILTVEKLADVLKSSTCRKARELASDYEHSVSSTLRNEPTPLPMFGLREISPAAYDTVGTVFIEFVRNYIRCAWFAAKILAMFWVGIVSLPIIRALFAELPAENLPQRLATAASETGMRWNMLQDTHEAGVVAFLLVFFIPALVAAIQSAVSALTGTLAK